jgi:hypothetical protein
MRLMTGDACRGTSWLVFPQASTGPAGPVDQPARSSPAGRVDQRARSSVQGGSSSRRDHPLRVDQPARSSVHGYVAGRARLERGRARVPRQKSRSRGWIPRSRQNSWYIRMWLSTSSWPTTLSCSSMYSRAPSRINGHRSLLAGDQRVDVARRLADHRAGLGDPVALSVVPAALEHQASDRADVIVALHLTAIDDLRQIRPYAGPAIQPEGLDQDALGARVRDPWHLVAVDDRARRASDPRASGGRGHPRKLHPSCSPVRRQFGSVWSPRA